MSAANSIDGAIGVLFPGWGQRRAHARLMMQAARVRGEMLSSYAAAEKNRLTRDWPTTADSADSMITADMGVLNARARAEVRDGWIGKSLVNGFCRNVVGTGITPRSAARDPETNAELEAFNRTIDRLWAHWARKPRLCDVERRKSFQAVQKLAVRELITVGQSFTILSFRRRNQPGSVVQVIETEQLDETVTKHGGNEVRNGIEVDAWGAPVAYHVCRKAHPMDSYRPTSERIEAGRVCHVMEQERPRQTHGVTRLSAVLAKARTVRMYDAYETLAKKAESCIGFAIQTTDASAGTVPNYGLKGPAGETGLDANNNTEWAMEPLMTHRLPPGEELKLINPQRPGAVYEPFMRQQLTEIAAGADWDYANLVRDFSQGSFSSQRQGLLELWKVADDLQLLLVDLLCQPVREDFKLSCILQGLVEAPGFFEEPAMAMAYYTDDWAGPPRPWIDPAREAAAAKIAVDYLLKSRQELAGLSNRDFRELLDEAAEARDYAKTRKITLPEHVAPGGAKTAPQEPRPTKNQPGEGDADDNGDADEPTRQSRGADGDVVDEVLADVLEEAGIPRELAAMAAEEN